MSDKMPEYLYYTRHGDNGTPEIRHEPSSGLEVKYIRADLVITPCAGDVGEALIDAGQNNWKSYAFQLAERFLEQGNYNWNAKKWFTEMCAALTTQSGDAMDKPYCTAGDVGEALAALEEWQISRCTGNPDLEHEKAKAMLKAVRAALTRLSELEPIIEEIVNKSHSHVDGRFLFEPLLHRKSIDIKKRLDGVETWYEGDWLSDLGRSIQFAANRIAKIGGV